MTSSLLLRSNNLLDESVLGPRHVDGGEEDDASILTKGPDGVVRQLKDRLRAVCKQRRIRLQEFFRPFDVHHNKKVTKGQFRRALDQAGVTAPAGGVPCSDLLTVKDVEILSKRYEVREQGDGRDTHVNYWKLCEQIEKVFARRGLEKNPTMTVKLSLEDRPESGYGVDRPCLSEEDADAVAALLERVRHLTTTEGLIVKTLFETFDKRHSGKVSASIFLRQLDSMFKSKLTKAESRLLLRAYQTRDGSVNYRAMHASCHADGDSSPVAAEPRACFPSVQGKECSQGHTQQQQSQRNQQKQQISGEREGDGDECASIVSSVTDFPERGAVDFSADKRDQPASAARAIAGTDGDWQNRHGPLREQEVAEDNLFATEDSLPVERLMASKVVYHRLQPDDAYAPYDPHRSGTVSEAVFRRGLSDAFRMSFSEEQLDALAARYQCGHNQVSYRRLCAYVCSVADNAAFGRSRHAAANVAGGVLRDRAELNDDSESTNLARVLKEIRATLRRRRLSLQSGFQDFDKRGEGHVTIVQLQRVLCSYGVLPADRRDQELLEKRYAATDDPRHPSHTFIAYRDLHEDLGEGPRGRSGGCLDVGNDAANHRSKRTVATENQGDCGNAASSVGSASGGSVAASQLKVFGKPTGLSRPAHSVVSEVNMTSSVVLGRARDRGVAELMAQLKAFAFRSRLRMHEFFRGDDPLRSGSISREKFGRCLLVTGFRFSPVELETLCDAFAHEFIKDKAGAPFVRYGALVDDVEGVFVVRDLERNPECDVDASITAAQASFAGAPSAALSPEWSPLSPEEEALVSETLRELAAEVHRRRLSLCPALRDFDRYHRGVIPASTFERALSLVGLLPGRRKTRLLRRKFAEVFTSPDARPDVNYRAFLAAVDRATREDDQVPEEMPIRTEACTDDDSSVRDSVDHVGEGVHTRSAGTGYGPIGEQRAKATPHQEHARQTPRASAARRMQVAGSARRREGGGSSSVQVVVREVARQVAAGWTDIADFLNDADRLKQGEISVPKLKVALSLAGVALTDEELRTLEGGFRSDRNDDMPIQENLAERKYGRPRHDDNVRAQELACQAGSGLGGGASNGRRDGGFNVTGACRREDSNAGTAETHAAEAQREDAVTREVVRKALNAVRHRVKHYRMHLKPCFQDFDPNRRKKITRQQFLSVLGNANLNLSERELDAVCRRYTVRERNPGVRVQYVDFCDEIDREEDAARTAGEGPEVAY